jgi:hypothetical protein
MEMKHSRTEVRNDLVYDVASDWQDVIQKHRGAARECAIETLTRRQRVANAAVAEASYQPPDASVRVVKAAFALAGSASEPQGSQIRLLFDSSSQPALAGTRSAASRIRQLLYRAEPYQIDLQIELQRERNYLVVTGQFLDVSRPQVVGRDVQVTVSNCGASVVNTVTNQFGEFRVEVENSGDLQLSFPGRGGKPIVILLRGVVNPSPEE